MCGIAGFFFKVASGYRYKASIETTISMMSDSLYHRGPDDSGSWVDLDAGMVMIHRRLAILDLSSAGHQPMISSNGRYIIAFNGEIYNHLELRAIMDGVAWRGGSDTETLLSAIETWGVEKTLDKLIGMFSFALWDKKDESLVLARDRAGEKPLYYGWVGNGADSAFVFGSELKAFHSHPLFIGDIDRDALCLYMRFNSIPAPHTIYKGIYKLQPGHVLRLPLSIIASGDVPDSAPYWKLCDVIVSGRTNLFNRTDREAVDGLESLLLDAIGKQMMADVPLGAFLSGGIDSSTVVALMQSLASRPVKTFSVGFDEHGYNEAIHAKAVANHLGADHTELYINAEHALGVIPLIPMLYDEPFADVSQIPTYLVSRLAKQHVTVSLSGDAGDELFGGYSRHVFANSWLNYIGKMPFYFRKGVAMLLRLPRPGFWSLLEEISPSLIQLDHRISKFSSLLSAPDALSMYKCLISTCGNPGKIVLSGVEKESSDSAPIVLSGAERMMAEDFLSYLPDDILVKLDRAAMAVSLESRIPFLDHRVIEYAWRLPLSMKIRDGRGKWVLRQVLYKYVPPHLIDRPKQGFSVPLHLWLRGPLREWAEDLLSVNELRSNGFFNVEIVRKYWIEHVSGKRNWQYLLWNVLVFQAWYRNSRCG